MGSPPLSVWLVCPTIGIRVDLYHKPCKIEGDPWTHKWMNMQVKFPSLMKQITRHEEYK